MRKARCGGIFRRAVTLALALVAASGIGGLGRPASATLKYGALQLSGNFETQNLVRHPEIDKYQFIQNRNTVRLRVDWDWLQKGVLIDKIHVPLIESSKIYLLYRGVYDGFYDIAPGGNQIGQERFDDVVGGPIDGNLMGTLNPDGSLKKGLYSRLSDTARNSLKWENTLREAYVDLKVKGAPLSFRLGRQQVIWGESDQFRLMDIWNPLDVTWHFQQESWDNIRIPLWLAKGLWDIGEVGPLSNTFLEVVYNPFDFQPNAKLDFQPRPWAVPVPNPLRNGQVQKIATNYFATQFDLQGTDVRHGSFKRNPQDASEVGVRFHAVTPQGVEFSTDYLYARGRGIGAAGPLGVDLKRIDLSTKPADRVGTFAFLDDGIARPVNLAKATGEVKFPYMHIFGLTGNYFEGDITSAVLRLEMAYAMGQPYQTVDTDKLRAPVFLNGAPFIDRPGHQAQAPQDIDKRDHWAGMIGFDRPTWIRFLNSKATWFLTGQFFWDYIPDNTSVLRGTSGAEDPPYYTPLAGNPGARSGGLGQWKTGPYAGVFERVQAGSAQPGAKILTNGSADPGGDNIRRWEHLVTFAATTFYRSGTIVPFIADAWDPVDDNNEVLWNIDYYYSNDFIITLQQKFFFTYGSHAASNDPWYAGGRFDRRDETGIKLTYQF